MTWRAASLIINGRPAHAIVEDRFADNPPCAELPHLAWFGVYCMLDPKGGFWDPAKGPQLDAIEDDLIRLAEAHGNGLAAYVQRLDTRGIREYYVYFGDGACMHKVLPELRKLHPQYRVEYDQIDGLKWSQYRTWVRRMPRRWWSQTAQLLKAWAMRN